MADPQIALAVRLAVALVFAIGAWAKFRGPARFGATLRGYDMLPGWAVAPVARGLPVGEAALALALAMGVLRPGAEAAAALLLVTFAAAMAINLLRGRAIDCGCGFCRAGTTRLRWPYVWRNAGMAGLLLAVAHAGLPDAAQAVTGVLGGVALFLVLEAANTLWALPASRVRISGGMTAVFVSQSLLWLVVVGLSLTVLALARQVGVLHERLAPVGALTPAGGPAVGQPAPLLRAVAMDGTRLEIGTRRGSGRALLMLFVARTCPICKMLIPIALDVGRAERLDVLFIGDAEAAEQRALMADFGISPADFVNGAEIGMAYRVDKLPHAVLLDAAGTVVAKGLVNSREHLESLVVAQELGVPSVQAFVRAQQVAA